MKKRLLSVFLCVCLALSLLPETARAADDAPHSHAVSVDCETTSGEQVTFQALTSRDGALYIDGAAAGEGSNYYRLPAGHYYLAEDVRLDKKIYTTVSTASVLDLCLNGYKLEYAGGGNQNVIFLGRIDQSLNICDCNPTGKDRTGNVIDDPISGYTKVIWGGVITGGTRAAVEQAGDAPVTLYGGTIAGNDSSNGTNSPNGGGVNAMNFVMHGGAITYNKAAKGGGVCAYKSFTMTGGEISGNWATGSAGGVSLGDSATTVTLSGNVVIEGNVAGTAKTPNNLCLPRGCTVSLADLGEAAGIGVNTSVQPTASAPVTVAVPENDYRITDGDFAKFSSDNSDYELKLEGGKIVLFKPHSHAWATAWTKNTTHHWHECTATDCVVTDDADKDGYEAHTTQYTHNEYTHWQTCAVCGEFDTDMVTEEDHDWESDADTTCNTCGYTRTITPGSTEGKVEVSDDAPAITTDNEVLKELAGTPGAGETVTVKLTVEKKDDAEGKADIESLITGGKKDDVLYLDLSLLKITESGGGVRQEDSITNAAKVLEIEVDYDFSGKKDVTVYRYHDGTAEALREVNTKADGTFSLDKSGGAITIYASKFSTYAIGYTPDGGGNQPKPPSGGGNGGSYVPPAVYPVELPASASGGKVTASHKSASVGTTVTITLTPEEGYETGGITVTDQNGKTVAVTDKGDGTYTFPMPSGKVTVKAEFTKSRGGYANCPRDDSCPIRRFSDADPAAWYHDGVHYCVENGLMSGYGGGLFGPDDNLSRAGFAQILYNGAGRPAAGGGDGFTDVPPGAWYADAVNWAAAQGIVSGYGDGRFGPGDSITREQLAVMLWRYAGSPAATEKELRFPGADKASGYALEALRWAAEKGIVGEDGGFLNPTGQAARAEAARMLKNFVEGQ